jgi:hypothetical protein
MDFSFKNSLIQNYFNGSNEYIPAAELVYLHEHPLINDSFLVELESLILKTSELLINRKVSGTVVNVFIELTKELGEQLPVLNATNSPRVIETLRKVYQLCNSLLIQYNAK